MKMNEGIHRYATEEAKKKWEGKKHPVKQNKVKCPSCEIKLIKKEQERNNTFDDNENN